MKKIKIYLVDDHSLFREGLKFLLSNLDFVDTIYEAENGEQFIAALTENPADVVLIDIEMPVMNGIEAAKQALKINPRLKIIALSMYSEEFKLWRSQKSACRWLRRKKLLLHRDIKVDTYPCFATKK